MFFSKEAPLLLIDTRALIPGATVQGGNVTCFSSRVPRVDNTGKYFGTGDYRHPKAWCRKKSSDNQKASIKAILKSETHTVSHVSALFSMGSQQALTIRQIGQLPKTNLQVLFQSPKFLYMTGGCHNTEHSSCIYQERIFNYWNN